MSQVRRSSSAVVILASPKTVGHSPEARLEVTMTEVCSQSLLIRWNRSCPPDRAKGEIARLVQDDEVEAHQLFGQPPGATSAGLGFQLVDQIHDVEE
jgi:hypothetical protein